MMPPEEAQQAAAQETVTVADQRAAGVPTEETVTVADQKAGAPLPDALAGSNPDAASAEPSEAEAQLVRAASNENAVLPPSAAAAAAKAHAALTHVQQVAEKYLAELDKYVPQSLIQAAEGEVKSFIRSIL